MPLIPLTLAQADSDDVVKILFGIIALIIWGVGAMASAAKKQKEQQRRRQMLDADPFRPPPPRSPPSVVRPVPPMTQPNVAMPPPPLVRPVPPLPPRVTPAPPRLQAPQVPRVMIPVPPQRRKQPPKKPPRRAAPAPPRIPRPVAVETLAPTDEDGPSAPSAFANEIRSVEEAKAAAAVARKPAVTAVALSRWLTPGTLRSQFILTEVLQPPLASRPDRLDAI